MSSVALMILLYVACGSTSRFPFIDIYRQIVILHTIQAVAWEKALPTLKILILRILSINLAEVGRVGPSFSAFFTEKQPLKR
jgi:hypothetical protein